MRYDPRLIRLIIFGLQRNHTDDMVLWRDCDTNNRTGGLGSDGWPDIVAYVAMVGQTSWHMHWTNFSRMAGKIRRIVLR